MDNDKKQIRKEIIKKRNSMRQDEIIEKSNLIMQKIFELDEFIKTDYIMCYMDFNNEVKTDILINKCFELHKKVLIPCVILSENKIIASEIIDLECDLELCEYDILAPKKSCIRKVNPKKIDIIIIPGVAFDKDLYRVGYGGGYYDKFLPQLRNDCLKIGVAFEMQIIDKVPKEQHDIKMDIIITENGIKK